VTPPPPELVERAQQFVNVWLRDQNIDEAISRVNWRDSARSSVQKNWDQAATPSSRGAGAS
jgi:hypothetical protein